MPKCGTKNPLFGYLWARFLKIYLHIWNQHPRICQTARFREKIKMLNLGPNMLYLSNLGLEF